MASKKKRKKKSATKKRPAKRKAPKAAKRKPAKRKATKRKAPKKVAKKHRPVLKGKVGKVKVTVSKVGHAYRGRMESPEGGSMAGAVGETPQAAMRGTKALLGVRVGGDGGGVREARLRRSLSRLG